MEQDGQLLNWMIEISKCLDIVLPNTAPLRGIFDVHPLKPVPSKRLGMDPGGE
ncbi:MAG TPA: hypothetical protein VFQ13_04570 [Anaerolineales bacterium]|nr:hypothetical protein [Anaerolineales bacterium]